MQKNAHFLGGITHILKKEVLFLQIVSIVLIERHCGENHRHRQHPSKQDGRQSASCAEAIGEMAQAYCASR